jgi:hypothetical protein
MRAANLHDSQGPVGRAQDFFDQGFGFFAVAEFVDVFHKVPKKKVPGSKGSSEQIQKTFNFSLSAFFYFRYAPCSMR